MSDICARVSRIFSRNVSLIADRRGALSFETAIVSLFLMISLLVPLADMAMAGFQFISARQALRSFGQSIQYNPPPDVTSPGSWVTTATGKADPHYPVATIQLICGDSKAVCSAANTVSPKYYSYSTTVTLKPMVLKPVLCTSGGANPCTFTLPYTERFQ
jgi:hypothetical protein